MILKTKLKKSLIKTLVFGVATTILSSASMIVIPKSVEAKPKPDYYCAQLNGVWTTWAKNNIGQTPIVRWKKTISQKWTPRNRCIAVSKRFRSLSDNGWLKDLTSGVINNQKVICGIRQTGDQCNSRNVLLTINTAEHPDRAIQQMLDIQARANGKVLELSGNKCFKNIEDYQQNVSGDSKATKSCIGKKMYYHMDNILDEIIKFEQQKGTIVTDESKLVPVTK